MNKKKLSNDRLGCGGKRPKAFIGAIIGAVGSIASGIIGNANAKKQAESQRKAEELNIKKEEAANLTQLYANDQDREKEFQNRFRQEYAKGGKAGIKPVITKGGYAKQLSNDTFLLRGNRHAQGGIVIGEGKNSIEAEGGEVIKADGKNLKILSAQPILNGKSPASKAIVDPSKANEVFAQQENYKNRKGINDDGTMKAAKGKKVEIDNTALEDMQQQSQALGANISRQNVDKFITNSINNDTLAPINKSLKSPVEENTKLTTRQRFNKAFASARKEGATVFAFEGKRYSTKLASKLNSSATNPKNVNKSESKSTQSEQSSVPKSIAMPIDSSSTPSKLQSNTVVPDQTKMSKTDSNKADTKSLSYKERVKIETDIRIAKRNKEKAEAANIKARNKIRPIEKKAISPSEQIQANKRLDKYFNTNNKYETPIFKCGGKVRKAALGTTESIQKDLDKKAKVSKGLDTASSIIGVAAPIISGIIGITSANKMKAPRQAATYSAAKLKTNYNINPQLAELERNRQQISTDIDRNTSSSVAALARKQRVATDTTMAGNQLYGQKENIETDLINKNKLNQQEQSNRNVATTNAYNDRLVEFNNNKIASKNASINNMLAGITGAAQDFQTRKDTKYAQNQEESLIAAGDVNNSLARMIESGYDLNKQTLLDIYNNPSLNEQYRELIRKKLGIITPHAKSKGSDISPLPKKL